MKSKALIRPAAGNLSTLITLNAGSNELRLSSNKWSETGV
jgi:hypothetical protein